VRRPPRRPWRALLASVACTAAVAVGCNPADTPLQRSTALFRDGTCEVGLVGDSLLVGARDIGGIVRRFEELGCGIRGLDARQSRSTREGVDIVQQWALDGRLPRVLVVALGTNDCSGPAVEPQVRRLLEIIGADRPVVWVNAWRRGCDGWINDALLRTQQALGARADGGNLWILNHWQWVADDRSVLATDGVHLTAEGYRRHAERIVRSVAG
jgi:lysophospholipase L1-like esterase